MNGRADGAGHYAAMIGEVELLQPGPRSSRAPDSYQPMIASRHGHDTTSAKSQGRAFPIIPHV